MHIIFIAVGIIMLFPLAIRGGLFLSHNFWWIIIGTVVVIAAAFHENSPSAHTVYIDTRPATPRTYNYPPEDLHQYMPDETVNGRSH